MVNLGRVLVNLKSDVGTVSLTQIRFWERSSWMSLGPSLYSSERSSKFREDEFYRRAHFPLRNTPESERCHES